MKKIKKYPLLDRILISFISLVTVLSISSVVFAGAEAYEASKTVNIENVENLTLNISDNKAISEDANTETLGGASFTENLDEIATSTTGISLQNNIGIYDRMLLGDNTNNVEYHVAIKEVFGTASTTVLSMQNKEGKTIWIDKEKVVYQPTGTPGDATINLAFGTSTTAYVQNDAVFFTDGLLTTSSGLLDFGGTLTKTTHPTSTVAVSTVYWGSEYPGTASYKLLPVTPGMYIVGFASSSVPLGVSSVTSTDSTLSGILYIPYYIVK